MVVGGWWLVAGVKYVGQSRNLRDDEAIPLFTDCHRLTLSTFAMTNENRLPRPNGLAMTETCRHGLRTCFSPYALMLLCTYALMPLCSCATYALMHLSSCALFFEGRRDFLVPIPLTERISMTDVKRIAIPPFAGQLAGQPSQ